MTKKEYHQTINGKFYVVIMEEEIEDIKRHINVISSTSY